eukprot:CAMPEP_0185704012 /NCGR_PEP_ID=MMETSP1164-20130828/16052_1 /TAXON_ID=1104430 /ORGANISM="Chrysoreinhardia sp, Strain CCMP2950" /LENGTH=114 /DNA_ID=CAMNT_0028371345 /DNA_START=590 /DNA_END=931 /DNA_ORIENTATION=+
MGLIVHKNYGQRRAAPSAASELVAEVLLSRRLHGRRGRSRAGVARPAAAQGAVRSVPLVGAEALEGPLLAVEVPVGAAWRQRVGGGGAARRRRREAEMEEQRPSPRALAHSEDA